MSTDELSLIVGTVLSLFFSYCPGLKTWYDRQSGEVKSLIMAAALVAVVCGIFAVSCWGLFDWVQCSRDGAKGLAVTLILALIANQPTYLITKNIGRDSAVTQ